MGSGEFLGQGIAGGPGFDAKLIHQRDHLAGVVQQGGAQLGMGVIRHAGKGFRLAAQDEQGLGQPEMAGLGPLRGTGEELIHGEVSFVWPSAKATNEPGG